MDLICGNYNFSDYSSDKNSILQENINPNCTKKKRKESRYSRKIKRNFGKSYKTSKGKLVKKRAFKPLNLCKNECKLNISQEEQKNVFNTYWNLGSYQQRFMYVKNLIRIRDKKRVRFNCIPIKTRRCTVEYSLLSESRNVKVCKK